MQMLDLLTIVLLPLYVKFVQCQRQPWNFTVTCDRGFHCIPHDECHEKDLTTQLEQCGFTGDFRRKLCCPENLEHSSNQNPVYHSPKPSSFAREPALVHVRKIYERHRYPDISNPWWQSVELCPCNAPCLPDVECDAKNLLLNPGDVQQCGFTTDWRRKICCPGFTDCKSLPTQKPSQSRPRPTLANPILVTDKEKLSSHIYDQPDANHALSGASLRDANSSRSCQQGFRCVPRAGCLLQGGSEPLQQCGMTSDWRRSFCCPENVQHPRVASLPEVPRPTPRTVSPPAPPHVATEGLLPIFSREFENGHSSDVPNGRSNTSQSCPRGSQCLPYDECSDNFPQDNNYRLQQCGFTHNWVRKVCCPKDHRLDSTTQRTRSSSVQTTSSPRPSTPIPRSPWSDTNACGISSVSLGPMIMGGTEAKQGMWPWMVAIIAKTGNGGYLSWCTGFLITRRHVLSAAHCFKTNGDIPFSTKIGNIDINHAKEYDISRIFVHDGYVADNYGNDIAIITLVKEVDSTINPLCLPTSSVYRNLTGKGTTVAGWGALKEGGAMSPRLRQLSMMPVVSNWVCDQLFRNVPNFVKQSPQGINKQFICAGFLDQKGKDSCEGDSGGPLMFQENDRWYAIGIIAFGYKCGELGFPGVYMRISEYLHWIYQNVR